MPEVLTIRCVVIYIYNSQKLIFVLLYVPCVSAVIVAAKGVGIVPQCWVGVWR
jgi:Fe2+ transport system protein B